jgi:hypothetical protein
VTGVEEFVADPDGTLLAAAGCAALVGIMHTLAGPDHWLPFVDYARERGWRTQRLLGLVFLCGVAHCCASVLLALLGVSLGASLTAFSGLNEVREVLAGMALLALGVVMLRPMRPHARGPQSRRTALWLLVVFVLGPCEWLVPFAMAAAARHGPQGLLAVSASFSCATVITMLGATLAAVGVLAPFWQRLGERRARILSAGLVFGSGALVLCGF